MPKYYKSPKHLAVITYPLRIAIVEMVMHLLTPKLYRNLEQLVYPNVATSFPRPMIEYISTLKRKALVGVEVGVSAGLNAENICKTLNPKRLVLVDSYLPFYTNGGSIESHELLKKAAFTRLKNKPVEWRLLPSTMAAKAFNGEEFDFVYIDANHEYTHVKDDISAWYPHVKKGGVIGGHDFGLHFPGVVQAVREFASSNGLIVADFYPDWWIIK